jgi:hypothetical protein
MYAAHAKTCISNLFWLRMRSRKGVDYLVAASAAEAGAISVTRKKRKMFK